MANDAPIFTAETYKVQDSFGFMINALRARMMAVMDRELAPLGITSAQWAVLVQVAETPGVTAAALCRRVHYDTGSMTRMLDRLEEKGLIRRARSDHDRRAAYLHLTETGADVNQKLPEYAARVLNAHFEGFSADEVTQLRDLMSRMLANAERLSAGT
ncbi:MarR family winged helix-turn-helix transcriptional regulator [Niveibacterium sp.]|uniref:MarR family winged helix-turn-helix transcriptional regulator n=1 Tax=Niveibacterium sp. TaxID=2017444 RepID=UPI0035B45A45